MRWPPRSPACLSASPRRPVRPPPRSPVPDAQCCDAVTFPERSRPTVDSVGRTQPGPAPPELAARRPSRSWLAWLKSPATATARARLRRLSGLRRPMRGRQTTVTAMQDREMVAAIVAGDPDGIAQAYDTYPMPLYSY